MSILALAIIVSVAVVVVSLAGAYAYYRSAWRKHTALVRARELITDGVEQVLTDGSQRGERISGHMDGRALVFEFGSESMGSYARLWTQIDVALADVVLLMNVRPQRSTDERDVRDGVLIDVNLGDPEFDAAFLVAAAPEAVVRDVFDAPTRAQMLRVGGWTLIVGPRLLQLRKDAWVDDARMVEEAMKLAVAVAVRIESAFAKIAAQSELAGAAGYRVAAGETAKDRAAREVAAAEETLARPPPRLKGPSTAVTVLVIGIATVVVFGVAYLALR